ncbi:MAG: hypothetical protein QOF58_4011, partial [Pseudonocardiales bacterium]|nr:hypothetical protein [Pseudonocardiales bacterium]
MTWPQTHEPSRAEETKALTDSGTFDHHDPRLADTLHETFADFRARCPVTRSSAHGGFVLVTRLDDIAAVAKDGATFSAAVSGLGAAAMFPGSESTIAPLFETDPPTHTAWRRLLQPFFAPAAVQAFEPFITSLVDEVVDDLVPRGGCEVAAELAARI